MFQGLVLRHLTVHVYYSNAVTQYSFVFINEKAKSSWTDQFIESKRIAEGTSLRSCARLYLFNLENNMIHGSMTSLLSQAATGPQLTFLYPMTLQLCRFGMQVCVCGGGGGLTLLRDKRAIVHVTPTETPFINTTLHSVCRYTLVNVFRYS